jgi:hypothetical protein
MESTRALVRLQEYFAFQMLQIPRPPCLPKPTEAAMHYILSLRALRMEFTAKPLAAATRYLPLKPARAEQSRHK